LISNLLLYENALFFANVYFTTQKNAAPFLDHSDIQDYLEIKPWGLGSIIRDVEAF
jgi:hypothetical protein